jgi:hypothetical protein
VMIRASRICRNPTPRISVSLIPVLRCGRIVGIGLLALAALSGMPRSQEASGGSAASTATVNFTLDFPQSKPAHYSISVNASGHAIYECKGTVAEGAEEQDYRAEFEVSAGNRAKIFDWAKQAGYFAGKIDSGNSKLAFTGAKQLSYRDGHRSNTARYNYSSLEPVRELTTLFQNMAGTLEYGHRLAYFHRYQKLALDDELKHMESQARSNDLSEIQGVAPILQEIVEDASVINVVRARARDLIQMGSRPAGH